MDEQQKLCAARAFGLSNNLNDAVVLIDELVGTGSVVIEIPSQSLMKVISGDEFATLFFEAVVEYVRYGWPD